MQMTNFMDNHFRYLKAGKKEYTEAEVLTIIDGAIAAEREACAKVAESYEPKCDTCPSGVANAIRARNQNGD